MFSTGRLTALQHRLLQASPAFGGVAVASAAVSASIRPVRAIATFPPVPHFGPATATANPNSTTSSNTISTSASNNSTTSSTTTSSSSSSTGTSAPSASDQKQGHIYVPSRNLASVSTASPSAPSSSSIPPPPLVGPSNHQWGIPVAPLAPLPEPPTPTQAIGPPSLILGDDVEHPPYWTSIPMWKDVSKMQFLDHDWQTKETVQGNAKLEAFLSKVLPETIPPSASQDPRVAHVKTAQDFIQEVNLALQKAPMSVRLTPHVLSVIDWSRPLDDPLIRQFIPLNATIIEDHPKLTLDSLGEQDDSPVPGLVHRYHDKALFLATSVCPLYCRFCTRSYSVGAKTTLVSTKKGFPPARSRWQKCFDYISATPQLVDIVVSGGDAYYLHPEHIVEIGENLLNIPHVERFRFASKGLAVAPARMVTPLGEGGDGWVEALIDVVNKGRKMGKHVCLHTHFNHPNEITWVTELAARRLFENGVTVRNQSVLLKGVNDDVDTMLSLIKKLGKMNIQPYYVYVCDMVKGNEDLRTPLASLLQLENQIRGRTAGFYTPNFIVDLPGGGGKRLASSYETYDRTTGISYFKAPGVKGGEKLYEYHDPLWSLTK
ncbi:hypothetical protein HDU97_009720 [Phlyctochytrium planicorne]|nr:hypothetical protein HDU97_009720 [Phlyctochytrium planicorne]